MIVVKLKRGSMCDSDYLHGTQQPAEDKNYLEVVKRRKEEDPQLTFVRTDTVV